MMEQYPTQKYNLIDISQGDYDPEREDIIRTRKRKEMDEMMERDLRYVQTMLDCYISSEKDAAYLSNLHEKDDVVKVSLINYHEDPVSFFDSHLFGSFRLNSLETTTAYCPLFRFSTSPVYENHLMCDMRIIKKYTTGASIGIVPKRTKPSEYNGNAHIVFYFKKQDVLDYLNGDTGGTAIFPDYNITMKQGRTLIDIEEIKRLISGSRPMPTRETKNHNKDVKLFEVFKDITALKFYFGSRKIVNISIFSYATKGTYVFEIGGAKKVETVDNALLKNPESKTWKREPHLKVNLAMFGNNEKNSSLASACIAVKNLDDDIRRKFSNHLQDSNLYIIARKIDLYHALAYQGEIVRCFGMTAFDKAVEMEKNRNTPEMLFPTGDWENMENIDIRMIKGIKIS